MLSAIYRSSFALALGRAGEAADHARRAIGMCEELDASVYKALASDALASCLLTRDEQENLRLSLKALLGPARQANRLRETMYLMTALGRIHLAAGDPRKALPPVREAIRLAQTGGLTLYELRAALLEGRALLLLERPEEAGRVLEAASARMAEGELRPLQAETLYWLAQAQEAAGDAAAAAQSTFLSAALISAMADEITDKVMREDYLSVALNRAVLQRAERLERSGIKPRLPSGARGMAESDPVAVAAEAHDEAVRALGVDAAPRRVIAFLVDRALRALRADHGLLILLSPDGHEVSISRELDSDLDGRALEPDLQAMARARKGEAVLSNDPCFLCAPLRPAAQADAEGRGAPLGALYFDSASSVRYFRDQDLRLAAAFADRAAAVLTEAQEMRQRVEKAVLLNRELARRYDMTRLVGESPAMERLFRMMEAVIGADCNVLLTGESGTGKEMVARAIHYAGARKDRDFVALNCGAVPDSLAESELFGHRRGAFSGADADRRGLFEEADGGTLFLDEIGNASPAFQAKLLRVLQSGELRRLGETITRKVDARIIAATNADIDAAIRGGRFREDLYYRLNVVTLAVPPLRERREDIPLLAEHFARALCEARGVEFRGIGQEALARLRAHDWPGNVRELEHTIESAFLLAKGGVIRREHLPGRLAGDDLSNVRDLLHETEPDSPPPAEERAMVERALASARGDKSQAARILGWSRMKLYRRLRSLEIPYDTGRASS